MNASNSTTSAGWPTNWPKDSFTGPGAWFAAAFIVIIVVLTAYVQAVVPVHPGHIAPSPAIVIAGIVVQGTLEAGIVAALLLALPKIARLSLRDLGFQTPTLSVIGTALLGAAGMIVVTDGGGALVDALAHADHQQQAVEIFKALHDRTAIIVFALFAVVLAPVAEETIFRVFAFNFGARYGGFWLGAPVSAVLFGLAHGDAFAAIPLALGGVVLCGVYYRSRNAYASMISHGLFNAFSIAGLLFAPHLVSN
ncbi:MAG TPA: CPBP family intramembrane glutamic endopeptidase [Candidatus Tumulicola sp.]